MGAGVLAGGFSSGGEAIRRITGWQDAEGAGSSFGGGWLKLWQTGDWRASHIRHCRTFQVEG